VTYLTDTHILIWALNDPARISATIRQCLADDEQRCLYSPVSLWEISIKYALGKLDLRGHTPEEFLDALQSSFFEPLPLDDRTITSSYQLRRRHGDPFDRLLIWQAIVNECTLLSADQATDQYAEDGLVVIH